jgi:hypothetical protein
MEVNGKLHDSAALTQGKSHWYPLKRRLNGLRGPSGRFTDEHNFCCCQELQHDSSVFKNVACS